MAPVACRPIIKCGKSGCTGSCPLWWNVGTKLGGSQLRAEPVGRRSRARMSLCQTSFPVKSDKKKGNNSRNVSCHVSTQPKHLTCHVSTVKCGFLERLTARSSGTKKCGCSHGGLHGVSSDLERNAGWTVSESSGDSIAGRYGPLCAQRALCRLLLVSLLQVNTPLSLVGLLAHFPLCKAYGALIVWKLMDSAEWSRWHVPRTSACPASRCSSLLV